MFAAYFTLVNQPLLRSKSNIHNILWLISQCMSWLGIMWMDFSFYAWGQCQSNKRNTAIETVFLSMHGDAVNTHSKAFHKRIVMTILIHSLTPVEKLVILLALRTFP